MRKISKQLKCDDQWAITEPNGKKGGMFVAWDQTAKVKYVELHEFYIELRIRAEEGESDFWINIVMLVQIVKRTTVMGYSKS